MEKVVQLVNDIDDYLKAAKTLSEFMSKLEPVTFHIKGSGLPFIGIARAVIDNKEQKRLAELLNKPLYNGASFFDLFYNIQRTANTASTLQVELQSILPPSDPLYYGKAREIVDAFLTLFENWYNYSFDTVNEMLQLPEGEGALGITAEYNIKESLLKMDLPDDLKKKCKLPKTTNNFERFLMKFSGQ